MLGLHVFPTSVGVEGGQHVALGSHAEGDLDEERLYMEIKRAKINGNEGER